MADYTKPPYNNIPFSFGTGGYTKPDFNDVAFQFKERAIVSTYANVGASIVGISDRDYVKYCPTYIIGYGPYGVQTIQGRCIYGGARDIGAYIVGIRNQGQADLGANLTGLRKTDQADLGAELIVALDVEHGEADLNAIINVLQYRDLGATLSPIPGKDLNAYLNVYPQQDLSASISGWEQRDLGAYITSLKSRGLPASIGAHSPNNLTARLKGWVREATSDLGAYLFAYPYEGLGGIIRATYLSDLGAVLNVTQPRDITASIYGWDKKDLGGIINGTLLDTDLSATINAVGRFNDLNAYIQSRAATEVPNDLSATISSWYLGNLGASVTSIFPGDLGGIINVVGGSGDLGASIYPKMIRLTTIISFVTMEHSDMSATLNICMGSESRNLSSYIRTLQKGDLGATITGKWDQNDVGNLGATIGYAKDYFVLDKVPFSAYISDATYYVKDKLPLTISMSTAYEGLGAYINGILTTSDLTANISVVTPESYMFTGDKNREFVYFKNYMGEHIKFETAEITFRSIVEDYFYVSASGKAYKTDRLEKWVTDVKSYIPRNVRLNIKRRFHRLIAINDITKFSSVDDFMKFAIDYVTDYPEVNLGASINITGRFNNLGASITPLFTTSENNNLTSTIVGTT